MSKICGYSCEHNKSGVCQISVCDKKSIISDKTEIQTLRLDELDYTIVPNSDIKPLLDRLQQENKQLKEQLLVTQTNEETFRLEMEDITQTLGLDEDALFDDVKAYARSLKNNWNTLKKWLYEEHYLYVPEIARNSTYQAVLDKMQELEQGSDSNE